MKKIKPCKKCGSKDIKFSDCGYSSFNCGGGTCRDCGFRGWSDSLGCMPFIDELISVWNDCQKPTDGENFVLEQRKTRILRKQLRDNDLKPLV